VIDNTASRLKPNLEGASTHGCWHIHDRNRVTIFVTFLPWMPLDPKNVATKHLPPNTPHLPPIVPHFQTILGFFHCGTNNCHHPQTYPNGYTYHAARALHHGTPHTKEVEMDDSYIYERYGRLVVECEAWKARALKGVPEKQRNLMERLVNMTADRDYWKKRATNPPHVPPILPHRVPLLPCSEKDRG
jgi:hypothetical protein